MYYYVRHCITDAGPHLETYREIWGLYGTGLWSRLQWVDVMVVVLFGYHRAGVQGHPFSNEFQESNWRHPEQQRTWGVFECSYSIITWSNFVWYTYKIVRCLVVKLRLDISLMIIVTKRRSRFPSPIVHQDNERDITTLQSMSSIRIYRKRFMTLWFNILFLSSKWRNVDDRYINIHMVLSQGFERRKWERACRKSSCASSCISASTWSYIPSQPPNMAPEKNGRVVFIGNIPYGTRVIFCMLRDRYWPSYRC